MIIRLRRKSNAKLAVFRIPSEILSEIFLFCIGGELTCNSRYAARTFDFIYVCWYWKMVAYETPQLWSTWPGGCVDAWPILHLRSKNAPLHIHLRDRPIHLGVLEPIFTSFDTFRRLRSFDFSGHASWLELFLKHFGVVLDHGKTSNIEDLRLNISCMGAMSGYETFERISRFFSLSFPKLHTLEIINLSMNWDASFPSLSSITDLTIRNPPNANRPKTEQLLSFIRRNPRLKKLILEDGALPQSDDTGGGRGCLRLLDLRNLQLTGDLLPVMRLLEHLKLPPELQYASITVNATGSSNDVIFSGIKPFLRSYYLSEDWEERRIDGLRLSLDDLQTTMLTISTTPKALVPEATPSQIPLSPMNIHIQTYQDKKPLSMDIFRFLPLDNLRDLSLESLEFTAEQSKLLFSRVRRVEELCVSASSGPGAIAALGLPSPPGRNQQAGKKSKGKATEVPANSKRQKGKTRGGKGNSQVWLLGNNRLTACLRSLQGGKQGPGASGKQSLPSTSQDGRNTITVDDVPLPKLKNLLLYEMVFDSRPGKKYSGVPAKSLVNLVRDRKKAGYGLQELGVQSCTGFGAKQVKACERVVKTVIWDEDEDGGFGHTCTHHNHYSDDEDDDYLSPNEYDAHYQIYGRGLWDFYDSDGMDDYLPYF